jgi:hypothetical protein
VPCHGGEGAVIGGRHRRRIDRMQVMSVLPSSVSYVFR